MSEGNAPQPEGPSAERIARGEKMFNEVYGGVVQMPPAERRDPYINDLLGHLFAEIWSRDILSIRDRRLLLLGAAIALGETPIVEIQLRAAVAKGELSREQLSELLLFIVNYVGYPRVSGLQQAINRVLADTKS